MVKQREKKMKQDGPEDRVEHFVGAGEALEHVAEGLPRRRFLQMGMQAAVALPFGGLLQACGGPVPESDPQDSVKPESFDKAKPVSLDVEEIKEDIALFPIGVQAGAITSGSALLWGYTGDQKPKKLRVWRETTTKGQIAQVIDKELSPEEGYFHEEVKELAPGTAYHYAFFDGSDKRSTIGSFRTAWIEDSQKPLTIAGTTCTNQRFMPYTSLLTTATFDYDVFVQLGDFSYNDGAETKQEFRDKWRQTLQDPGYRAVLSKTGNYLTWDDHEISNDSVLYNMTPEERKVGTDAFYETTTIRPNGKGSFWTSYCWGKTAEIFILDCRGERDPESRGKKNETYISRAQMDWFKQGLLKSKCHFKVVLNSVPISSWKDTLLGNIALQDRWEGYQTQRREILDHIVEQKISNVWWLTGDLHLGAVSRLDPEGPYSKMVEIMVGPGGQLNPLWPFYQKANEKVRESYFPKKQFFHFGGELSATLVTFDPKKDEVTIKFVHHETKKLLFEQTLSASKL